MKSFLLRTFAVQVLMALSLAFAAEKIPPELENVGIEEHLGAQVDLNLNFKNELGQVVPLRSLVDGRKPVILNIVYFTCPNLCNFFLNGFVESLQKLQWGPGKEFQILTVSMDPRETAPLAIKKKESYLKFYGRAGAEKGWHFWTEAAPEIVNKGVARISPDEQGNVKKLAEQVGFKYKFNKEENQFAHTAAMMILTPDGRVSRYLYGIEFKPTDLRLALVEASGNKIGNVMDRLLLFCYHYDPKTKKYALYANNLMRAAGALTTVILGFFLVGFWRRERFLGSSKQTSGHNRDRKGQKLQVNNT